MTLRRSLVPWCVLVLLPLQSCLTQALWSDDDEGEERVLVDEVKASHLVAASLGADSALYLLPATPPAAGPPAWRLVGEVDDELAITLLTTDGPLRVDELIVDAGIEWERGEAVFSEADLRIVGTIDASRLGEPIAWNDLPAPTVALLQQQSGPRFAFASPQPVAVPSVFHRCAERLRELDLTPLAVPASSLRAPVCVATVLVDAALQPFDAVPADPGTRPGASEPTFAENLHALEPGRFVVLMTDGTRQSLFVVRADRVPLWSGLAPRADGRYEQRSHWAFGYAGGVEQAPRWRGTLHVAERRFEWGSASTSVWERLLLTPVTMLGDLVGLWLWEKVFGADEDADG